MTSKSTSVLRYILVLTIFILSTFTQSYAQVFMPTLNFVQSHLVSKTITNSIDKVLSVDYSSFDAYALNNTANITWTTESETNNDHFEVERSLDRKEFKTIALVFGPEGNATTTNKYSFNDKAKDIRSHDLAYYRLKQIDFDGNVTYTEVKMVRFGTDTQATAQIFPHPGMIKGYNKLQ